VLPLLQARIACIKHNSPRPGIAVKLILIHTAWGFVFSPALA